MAGVAVVTDSTSSLPRLLATEAGVTVIPLQVVIDGVSRAEAVDDATTTVVAHALRAGQRVTTSRPTPEAFAQAFELLVDAGHEAIVSAHLSSAMSGTYAAAGLAAESASVPVTVIDTRTLAMATGWAVLAGARAASSGAGPDRVSDIIARTAAAASTFFCVESLEFLRRGGRIGAASALLGSALSVKPLLTVSHGLIRPHERVRTTSKAVARLEELAVAAATEAAGAGQVVDVAVHHLDNAEAAERLSQRVRERVPALGELAVAEMSAVLGAHVGPGTLGVVVSPRLPA